MSKKIDEQLNHKKLEMVETSIFSMLFFIWVFIIISAILVIRDNLTLGIVMLCLAFIGILGRVWTRLVSRNVKIKVDSNRSYMFPGDKSNLVFYIENQKAFPISFIEITKPLNGKKAVLPEDYNDEEEFGFRCSLIKGYEKTKFETKLEAINRGILQLTDMTFNTGDPFGLACVNLPADLSSKKEIVVYPRIIPVNTRMFTKDIWYGEHNKKGVLEDVSVIKLTRPYQETDSLKNINWRLLARSQEMMTNQYEVISPKRIHFFFDGSSFDGISQGSEIISFPKRKELENALSILASLAVTLNEENLFTGFSFQETPTLKAENIRGEEGSLFQVLYRMADFDLFPVSEQFNEQTHDSDKVFKKTRFNEEEIVNDISTYGKCYYVSYGKIGAQNSSLLNRLDLIGIHPTIITYKQLLEIKEIGGTNEKS